VFAIGDFSKLARVTVKALRLYDQMGLLKPAKVDAASGYRYYSAAQLPRLNRLLVLKELGFSLESAGRLLDAHLSSAELRGMLQLRREEQAERLAQEQARLKNLERWIDGLDDPERSVPMEILTKSTGPKWLVGLRGKIDAYQSVGQLFGEVYGRLGPKSAGGLPVAIWHDSEYRESDIDAEAGVLLDSPIPVEPPLHCRELPVQEAACYVYRGSYASLGSAYQRLTAWIEARNLAIAGPAREIYLQMSSPVRQDDETYVTELQIPVKLA
jgi:DNA-binding transcriptional MerR regulator